MARPIHANPEATRKRVITAASQLFSEQGLGQTSMRQLAGLADVSMATIHHHFGGKDGLYRACIDTMFQELGAMQTQLSASFSEARDIDQAIELMVQQAYSFVAQHRTEVQLLMRDVLQSGELAPEDREHRLPLLQNGAEVLAPWLGLSPRRTRIALMSINYLIVRFALNSSEEQARICQMSGGSEEEIQHEIANYLAIAAKQLLGRPVSDQ